MPLYDCQDPDCMPCKIAFRSQAPKTLSDERTICTEFWQMERLTEWRAWREGDEPDDKGQMRMGIGQTEDEAIDELLSLEGFAA